MQGIEGYRFKRLGAVVEPVFAIIYITKEMDRSSLRGNPNVSSIKTQFTDPLINAGFNNGRVER